jgi:hypothetical protein
MAEVAAAGGAPRANRLDRRKTRTGQALIDAAVRLIARGRGGRASIAEITEEADLGFGSFYNFHDPYAGRCEPRCQGRYCSFHRRSARTISAIASAVSWRAQSRCSSHASETQVIGCPPACSTRSRPARWASGVVPPIASVTG